jgi:hypothetical protein
VRAGVHQPEANINTADGAYAAIVPDYQRDRVWTPKQSALYVGAMLENGPTMAALTFVFQRWPESRHTPPPDEIVDGLQRITALRDFMSHDAPAELSTGEVLRLSDFDAADQHRIGAMLATIQYVTLPTRAAVLSLYLRLNRGGTVHTDAEIDRVRALLAKETQ